MSSTVLEFAFTLEPGMSDSDIEKLWNDTIQAQNALDKFLAGEFSEQEMTDLLSLCEVDIEETREQCESNAQFLKLTPI